MKEYVDGKIKLTLNNIDICTVSVSNYKGAVGYQFTYNQMMYWFDSFKSMMKKRSSFLTCMERMTLDSHDTKSLIRCIRQMKKEIDDESRNKAGTN